MIKESFSRSLPNIFAVPNGSSEIVLCDETHKERPRTPYLHSNLQKFITVRKGQIQDQNRSTKSGEERRKSRNHLSSEFSGDEDQNETGDERESLTKEYLEEENEHYSSNKHTQDFFSSTSKPRKSSSDISICWDYGDLKTAELNFRHEHARETTL